MRLCSIGFVCGVIIGWANGTPHLPTMVDVALIRTNLSTMVQVPQAVHACINSPSAAPFITCGYAAVRPCACDAESSIKCLTHFPVRLLQDWLHSYWGCTSLQWRLCWLSCLHASTPMLLRPCSVHSCLT